MLRAFKTFAFGTQWTVLPILTCIYIQDYCCPAFIRSMVCRVVLNSRATALILTPALRRSATIFFCSSLRVGGRPKRFPADLAREIPECVRSSSKSRSNSATAEITCMVIFPAGPVRSTPHRARQCKGNAGRTAPC